MNGEGHSGKSLLAARHNDDVYWSIGIMVRVFTNGQEDQRLKKWYKMPPCVTLSIIRYGSRVSGTVQVKE